MFGQGKQEEESSEQKKEFKTGAGVLLVPCFERPGSQPLPPQTHTSSSSQQREKLNSSACPQIPCSCSTFAANRHPAPSSTRGKGLARRKLAARERCRDRTFAFCFSPSFCPCFAWWGCPPRNPAAGAQQHPLSCRKPAACGVFLGHGHSHGRPCRAVTGRWRRQRHRRELGSSELATQNPTESSALYLIASIRCS